MQSALRKSSPNVSTLVKELCNGWGSFLRLLEFPDLFGKVFLINLKCSYCDFFKFLQEQCKQSKFSKTFKLLVLALFYCFSQKMLVIDWWKLVCIDQSRFCISYPQEISTIFHIATKCFFIFNNMLPASRIVHVTRAFLACYSWSYYSSMVTIMFDSIMTNRSQVG